MTDEDLIGFLIGALPNDEHAALAARLATNPAATARLEKYRLALAHLECERDSIAPPLALATRTMGRLSGYFAELEGSVGSRAMLEPRSIIAKSVEAAPEPFTQSNSPLATIPHAHREAPESRTLGGRIRFDILIACGIALFACGIVFSAIGKVRVHYQMLACQANLATLHTALAGYADVHDGHYPQIGANASADSFATELMEAGQLPSDFKPQCPAAPRELPNLVSYTYTLGFQEPSGGLSGLRRPDATNEEHDLLPISADYPTATANPAAGPLCGHPPQMNVLYAGGHVRSTTSPLIGPNGDDIYQNVFGHVAAGINRSDVVLGRPGDIP